MSSVEVRIFGQSFRINPPDGDKDFCLDVASSLDEMLETEGRACRGGHVYSDVRVAIMVAFRLALENRGLTSKMNKGLEILDRIDNKISSCGA